MSSEATGGSPGREHFRALTGIRGIAAWMVVLYHIRFSLDALVPAGMIAALGKGYLAVDLFFILSGFVLWYNYADRLRGGGLGDVVQFMWRRVARIWPLHLFILATFVVFALLLLLTGRSTADYPFGELPLHVFLIQNWGFTGELAWNHPAWSISTELAAYLLFPLIVCAARWERLGVPVLVCAAVALLAAIHLVFASSGSGNLGHDIPRLGLWRCLAEFALGNIACMLWRVWRAWRYGAAIAAMVCAVSLAAGLAFSLPETLFVPTVFFAGILALALDRGVVARLLGTRSIHYLGEISYSTYLVHYLLFIVFKLLFLDASLQLGWAGLAGFLLLALAASVLLYHGVEKPAQGWMNRHRPNGPLAPKPVPAE
ncbi:MAG: acyltransferase [Novosphingobium sp.]|nr:acyltransferase [Novosphingobium sp.]